MSVPRKPRLDETRRFTLYGYQHVAPRSPTFEGVPIGHRPTIDEARALVPTRRAEGYRVVKIVERDRDYPYTRRAEHAL